MQISCGILHCNIINVWQRLDFIRLGNILNEAEKLFGERNRNYTLLGVELIDRDYPQIWFPCNCGNIVIQITIDCLNNMDKAIFFKSLMNVYIVYVPILENLLLFWKKD